MVFAIMICIIFYQFYFFYVAKSKFGLKFSTFLLSLRTKMHSKFSNTDDERTPLIFQPPRAVIRLRESLLEED